MSIFESIKKAIFGEAKADTVAAPTPARVPGAAVPPSPATVPAGTAMGEPTTSVGPAPMSSAVDQVDVAPILDKAVKDNGQPLDWKVSIVDLLKALKIDSSLTARKELAHELGYTGDTNDSATMNMWLHKAVIKKLAENGGKVTADLMD
ncbi:hypothetical protein ASE63_25100 [Bosea sp. Root381]|uniref:DUF3597 domain-containing protein n=1 Tax=Bosea sp. Root381 TaxID=1736524 RepID=UPI0006FA685F|nr:DUF3597 domain-containing protein [Bosea sp. Root381]KRE05043.1 hypothetical protein ASE63_25100 [Bosea sp. Root381]